MSIVGEPGQAVTLLHFRRSLPASAWLRASILWADNLAAIWPESRPTAFNDEQQQSEREIYHLGNAGLFRPKYIFDLSKTEAATKVLEDLGKAEPCQTPSEAWQDGASAVGSISASAGQYDPETFVHIHKLPQWIIEELLRRNLLRPGPNEYGYEIDSEILNQLLAAHATVLSEASDGWLVPDAEVPAQARRIAAPSPAGDNREALVFALRSATKPDLVTDFRRFIDFRLEEKTERARKAYIEQLTDLWNLCARGGPEHAAAEITRSVVSDLRKARTSYFKRITGKTLAEQGLTSLGVVIPLLIAHPPAAVVGAISGLGAAVMTVAVRKNAPMYVRAASKSELLAPTGI